MGSAQAAAWRRPPPRWPRPGRARLLSPFPGSSRAGPARPPARPPPARPAHSPADGLVGQLLHAVELLLHGGGGGGGRPRGSGRGEQRTVWRFLHRFPAREAATEATIRPRPRRVTSSAAARPSCLTEWGRAEPNKAEPKEVESSR